TITKDKNLPAIPLPSARAASNGANVISRVPTSRIASSTRSCTVFTPTPYRKRSTPVQLKTGPQIGPAALRRRLSLRGKQVPPCIKIALTASFRVITVTRLGAHPHDAPHAGARRGNRLTGDRHRPRTNLHRTALPLE